MQVTGLNIPTTPAVAGGIHMPWLGTSSIWALHQGGQFSITGSFVAIVGSVSFSGFVLGGSWEFWSRI
jgi:hypothetical protein